MTGRAPGLPRGTTQPGRSTEPPGQQRCREGVKTRVCGFRALGLEPVCVEEGPLRAASSTEQTSRARHRAPEREVLRRQRGWQSWSVCISVCLSVWFWGHTRPCPGLDPDSVLRGPCGIKAWWAALSALSREHCRGSEIICQRKVLSRVLSGEAGRQQREERAPRSSGRRGEEGVGQGRP